MFHLMSLGGSHAIKILPQQREREERAARIRRRGPTSSECVRSTYVARLIVRNLKSVLCYLIALRVSCNFIRVMILIVLVLLDMLVN